MEELKEKEIKIALDDAYKKAGHNAYFGNGFRAGIEFALKQPIGNKLTTDKLKSYGFIKQITRDYGGDEIKWWIKDGISIHEESWWITELDKNGNIVEPVFILDENEIPVAYEIEFAFATYIKMNGSFKGGYSIDTDRQLEDLYYSLTKTKLININPLN